MSLLERISSHQTASGSGLLQQQRSPAPCVLHRVCGPVLRARQCSRAVLVHSSSRSEECPPSSSGPVAVEAATQAQQRIDDHSVKTRFIAETLLPTRHGKFRLRGYKHSVRPPVVAATACPAGLLSPLCCLVSGCCPPASAFMTAAAVCCCSLTVGSRSRNPQLS